MLYKTIIHNGEGDLDSLAPMATVAAPLLCLCSALGWSAGARGGRPTERTHVQLAATFLDDEAPGRLSVLFGEQPPSLSLVAPAKVNLFLRILRKREDGYHELASLFQTVSLFDDLDFWEMPRDDTKPLCSMEVSRVDLPATERERWRGREAGKQGGREGE
eukprot:scaffold7842_cov27-Tisochrysis_lutea.AAC.1